MKTLIRNLIIPGTVLLTGCGGLATKPDSALTQALQHQASGPVNNGTDDELSLAEIKALIASQAGQPVKQQALKAQPPLDLQYEGNSPQLSASKQQALLARGESLKQSGQSVTLRCTPPTEGDPFSRSHLALKRCKQAGATLGQLGIRIRTQLSHDGTANSIRLISGRGAP